MRRQTRTIIEAVSFTAALSVVIAVTQWCCAPPRAPVEIERITIVGSKEAGCDPKPIVIGVDLSHCEWVPTGDAGAFHCIGARPYTETDR